MRFFTLIHSKYFPKKNNKQTQNNPDNLKYNTTDVHHLQPPYGELFCINFTTNFLCHIYLFLFVRTYFYRSEPILICQNFFVRQNLFSPVCSCFYLRESFILYDHLWKFLLVYDHLWESIFLSLYEKKQVYEYHRLKQIFYHQNINDILLISYVPILCFLLWILFIFCLTTFLLKCPWIH